MTHRLLRKRWLCFAMALSLFAVLLLGVLHLAIRGTAHVKTMDPRQLQTFSSGPLGSIGQVFDRRGEPLFTPGQPVDRSVHSLVGSLSPMISNSVVQRCQGELMGRDGYDLWQGASSLEGSGSDLFLTLDGPTQKALTALLEQEGLSGFVAACNASTGALLCLVSTPAASSDQDVTTLPDGALLNKTLSPATVGSTMKVVTTALLAEQAGPDALTACRCLCQGSDPLDADGAAIVCSTRQGTHDIVSALGVSCNVFFANAVQEFLDVEATQEALVRFGFAGQEVPKDLGPLTYAPSQVTFSDFQFASVWSLLGQVSQVSPLDLLRFTSALFHEGQAPTPYLLSYQSNRTHTELSFQEEPTRQAILSPETAETTAHLWREAYATYYDTTQYTPLLTAAKTGTAQQGDGTVNKLLLGYAESLDVVFLLSLEDWTQGKCPPQKVANCLLDQLAQADQVLTP